MTDEFTAVPLLDLRAQYVTIRDEVEQALKRVVEAQSFILGPEVKALENEIAAYSQCAYGIGVSSGTDALLAALMAIDLKAGDEVITTAYSFFATAGAVARLGAVPVFVDIDPFTYNIDVTKIERVITTRTRAIIPVHLYGQMADMDPIMELAGKCELHVIEDAAQAIGAEYKGRRAGSIGNVGCLSFFPSKNLGAFGDGGMVITNNPKINERLRLLRNHGYQPKYHSKIVGANFRLDAIQAAVLRVKLRFLEEWTAARRYNAAKYRALFEETGLTNQIGEPDNAAKPRTGIVLPVELSDYRHIYNQFVIRCGRRDHLAADLKSRKIGTEIYYPLPLHLQECFSNLGYKIGDLPVSEQAAKDTLALPIYPELRGEMLRTVVNAIASFYRPVGDDTFRSQYSVAL